MAGKNKKKIRSFEAQNVRLLRSSSLIRILRLLIKKFSVYRKVPHTWAIVTNTWAGTVTNLKDL